MDEKSAAVVREQLTKGQTGGHLFFTTDDCKKTYEELVAKSAERFLTAETVRFRDAGYSFSYSSHLGDGGRAIRLPDQINLSNDAYADVYQHASVTIPSLRPGRTVTVINRALRPSINPRRV